MKSWAVPTTVFLLGLGLGLSGPLVANRYLTPYMPVVFQPTRHPLEGIVTHKQHDQDRLLMTVTTDDGTILATFKKQVAEIALLVEEQDTITLDVKKYEPFVNDPPVLKVKKQRVQTQGSNTLQPPTLPKETNNPLEPLLPNPTETDTATEQTETSSPPLNE